MQSGCNLSVSRTFVCFLCFTLTETRLVFLNQRIHIQHESTGLSYACRCICGCTRKWNAYVLPILKTKEEQKKETTRLRAQILC